MSGETLISLAVVGALIAGAVWFAKQYLATSAAKRDKVAMDAANHDARARLAKTGQGVNDPPPIWVGEDLAHKILNDGVASNAQHVDDDFRREYWKHAAEHGMAVAFRRAMYARCWKSGSQGQVYDRLKSHGQISEHERNAWKRHAESTFPSGYGAGARGCRKVAPS